MSQPVKTRFIIRVDGIERQLFSSVERANDLSVILGFSGGDYRHEETGRRKWKSIHISLHPSQDAVPSGRSLTQVFTSSMNKEGLRRSAFVKKLEGTPFIWPVYGEVSCRGTEIKKISSSDILKRLTAFSPKVATLCYFVIATDRQTVLPRIQGLSEVRQNYAHFDVIVLYGFYQHPITRKGMNVFLSTSASRVERRPSIPNKRLDATSFGPQDLEVIVYGELNDMIAKTEIVQSGSIYLRRPVSSMFARWPSEIDEKDIDYGENPYRGTPRFISPVTVEGRVKTQREMEAPLPHVSVIKQRE